MYAQSLTRSAVALSALCCLLFIGAASVSAEEATYVYSYNPHDGMYYRAGAYLVPAATALALYESNPDSWGGTGEFYRDSEYSPIVSSGQNLSWSASGSGFVPP